MQKFEMQVTIYRRCQSVNAYNTTNHPQLFIFAPILPSSREKQKKTGKTRDMIVGDQSNLSEPSDP